MFADTGGYGFSRSLSWRTPRFSSAARSSSLGSWLSPPCDVGMTTERQGQRCLGRSEGPLRTGNGLAPIFTAWVEQRWIDRSPLLLSFTKAAFGISSMESLNFTFLCEGNRVTRQFTFLMGSTAAACML